MNALRRSFGANGTRPGEWRLKQALTRVFHELGGSGLDASVGRFGVRADALADGVRHRRARLPEDRDGLVRARFGDVELVAAVGRQEQARA
eukprot:7376798-Prymnesium_polylepis.3